MEKEEYLDYFEKTLETGLVKICKSAGVLGSDDDVEGLAFISPDIEQAWDRYVKEYVADAVGNFNDFPQAAIGFSAFLGMAVAWYWDKDWQAHSDDEYRSFYGPRGFDDMDDHILEDILRLDAKEAKFRSELMISCATAVQVLMRREQIEAQTDTGFYALTRSYGAMFRIGAAIELKRLGYKKMPFNTNNNHKS